MVEAGCAEGENTDKIPSLTVLTAVCKLAIRVHVVLQ